MMVRITLQQRSEGIIRRQAEGYRLPSSETLMNAGLRRTEDKRRLLLTVAEMAADRSRPTPFEARF